MEIIEKTSYADPKMAICEANGLNEIRKTNTIPVVKVETVRSGHLKIEKIKNVTGAATNWWKFGQDLARLHKSTSKDFGFYEDNFIGDTPQKNSLDSCWAQFYWENRLCYQIRRAAQKKLLSTEEERTFLKIEPVTYELLTPILEPPSLCHGDLWSGNFVCDSHGVAHLIDPAVYYGHRETDLAMTKLFGGFSPQFYDSYNEHYPLDSGYLERENLYKLYHVLNHLNLFGHSYKSQAVALLLYYL